MYALMPGTYKKKIKELLKFSGSKKTPQGFVNYSFSFSFAIGFITGLFSGEYFLMVWLSVFAAMFLLFHGFLILAVDRRSKFIERILPDALQLVAANLKSGYIPSRALMLSARREFGPLSEAIRKSGKEMMTGKSLQESLKEIPKTIKSDILDTTIRLVIEGIRAGGQLVSLFEETANDIRRKDAIKKEVTANIMMYSIFIGFAGCVGAPALYALSSYLVVTISQLGGMTQIPEGFAAQTPMMNFGLEIPPDFLFFFSIMAIIMTTFFGGMIIGLIGSGKERAGIKYVPILMLVALIVFFVTRAVISTMFGSIVLV